MATSSKTVFKLETLKEQALRAIDEQIAAKVLEVESYDDDAKLGQRVVDWRARQEARVSDLFRRLGDESAPLSNELLASFKIDKMPSVDRWDRNRAESDLRQLNVKRAKIIAKMEALVPDEDGNLSLTKTQLSEFFGL